MTTSDRLALIYGLSILSSGVVSWASGRKGQQVAKDAILGGVAAGTALNVVVWYGVKNGAEVPGQAALSNAVKGMGKLSQQGVELLAHLNTDDLYSDMKDSGVKVAQVPENPSIVKQDLV